MKIIIELAEQTLKKIQDQANKEKRSRKATIEKVVEDHFG